MSKPTQQIYQAQALIIFLLVYRFCQKLSLQFQNKMSSAKNMDFHQYCGDMSQSIDYLQSQMGNESPIYRNNLFSIHSFTKLMPACSSDKDLLDAISIDDHPIGKDQKYKCFKCYGTKTDIKLQSQLENSCLECEGTQFISDSHALAHILQKVLMLKLPTLLTKEDTRKNKQLNSLFSSQNSIRQEESCSYYPDQGCRQCSSCYKQQEAYKMFGCKQCKDFLVCMACYQKKKYSHPLDHGLYYRDVHKISLRVCPMTMKRISEEGELEDNSNYLDSSESLEIKCHNCNGLIQECYEACLNCENDGYQFIICAECSRKNNFTHQSDHQLAMKTLKQASKLLRLSSKPSASESEVTQPTPSKLRIKPKESIVMFQNYQYEDGQGNSLIDKNEQGVDLSHLLVKKKVKKMQDSVVSIDMECSIQAPSIQEEFTPTVIPYAFSNTSNFRIEDKNFNPEEYLFNDYQCDICNIYPIKNKRYHCKLCENFDLCEICYETRSKRHEHKDYELIDGLQIIKKSRQSLITKMQSKKTRLSLSRVQLAKTRFSQYSSFK